MKIKPYIAALLLFIVSCTTGPCIRERVKIDYRLYQGKWYEIARLPNSIEEGLTCITMTYEQQDNGMMLVTSRGRSKTDPADIKTLTGRAWIPDAKKPEYIKIQFIWPITIDYILIHIDETKGYAVLGSPSKHQLWFLSRSRVIIDEDMAELLKIAVKNNYKTDRIVRVEQVCD